MRPPRRESCALRVQSDLDSTRSDLDAALRQAAAVREQVAALTDDCADALQGS